MSQPMSATLKALALLSFVKVAWLTVIVVIYLHSIGMSAYEIGWITFAGLMARGLSQTYGQYLSDSYEIHKELWLLSIVGMTGFVVLIATSVMGHGFLTMCLLFSIYEIFRGQAGPTMNALTVAHLKAEGRDGQFGKIRMWASVGYGGLNLIFAALVHQTGSFRGAWLGFCAFGLLEAHLVLSTDFTVLTTAGAASSAVSSEDATEKESRTMQWLQLFSDWKFVLFLALSFCYGACSAVFESLLTVYVSTLTSDATVVGACTLIQCVSEVPMLFYGHLLHDWLGPTRVVSISMAAFCLRCVLTSMVPSAYWILPVQMLHGLTMAAFFNAGVQISQKSAPSPALQASAQGLFLFAFQSAGQAAGAVLGGYIFAEYGGRQMYWCTAGLVLVVFCVWTFFTYDTRDSAALELEVVKAPDLQNEKRPLLDGSVSTTVPSIPEQDGDRRPKKA